MISPQETNKIMLKCENPDLIIFDTHSILLCTSSIIAGRNKNTHNSSKHVHLCVKLI